MVTIAVYAMSLRSRVRRIIRILAVLGVTTFCMSSVTAQQVQSLQKISQPLKVVVHINFGEEVRQGHGLKNVENIVKSAESMGISTDIEVVCHSDGIVLLEKTKTGQATQIEALQKKGVRFAACENTMRQRTIRKEDLLNGVTTVPSGAFEIVVRQQQGYSYFKP
jgi:hypothetical protein